MEFTFFLNESSNLALNFFLSELKKNSPVIQAFKELGTVIQYHREFPVGEAVIVERNNFRVYFLVKSNKVQSFAYSLLTNSSDEEYCSVSESQFDFEKPILKKRLHSLIQTYADLFMNEIIKTHALDF